AQDMMEPWWPCQFALITLATVYLTCSNAKNAEFLSDTLINNVVADPRTGRLYIGAVNGLYQLNPNLELESRTETGPKRDNRQCTPPVTDACEEAVDTDNHNKLLLVHSAKDMLVVCGSVFRGICSLRNLSNVEQLLYFSDTKGEKSYVASGVFRFSSVCIYVFSPLCVQVGKGYGSHDSTKLISTRILQDYGDWVVFDSIIEASAVQANPFVLRYLHDFRFAFKDGGFVYFLFSRTLGVQDTKNFTFISRMCEDDQGYYSYTELQLNCSATNKYNKVQAAYVAVPGEVLAQSMTATNQYGLVSADDKVLFVTFTSDEDALSSAMCMYPLQSINKRLVEIIGACYSDNGIINKKAAVYSPYSSKSEELCSSSNQHNMALKYKCGAEFLPSPLASKAEFALTTEPSLIRKGHMTAVAVAVAAETGHAVAFVVRKIIVISNKRLYTYLHKSRTVYVPIFCFLLKLLLCFCPFLHFYVCIFVDYVSVPVIVTVNNNIKVTSSEYHFYNCAATVRKNPNTPCISCVTSEWGCQWNAQDHSCSDSDDTVDGDHIVKPQQSDSCPQFEAPEPLLIPVGFEIPISFQGRNLEIYAVRLRAADEQMKHLMSKPHYYHSLLYRDTERKIDSTLTVVLYNCSVKREDCSLCKHADSKYHCVWCATSQTCVYRDLCLSPQPAQCPNPEITDIIPRFGPLNGRIAVTIKGSNMGIKKEDIKKITVAGVDFPSFVYIHSVVCEIGPAKRDPPSDVPFEPRNQGAVTVQVEGGRTGTSRVIFTYRDPKPDSVEPAKGPAAGGTVITIQGEDLDTATKDDIAVTVGGVSCEVLSFGTEITCKTGRYRGQKVPSDALTVSVKYGKNTTKDVPSAYQYSENPKITDYNPKDSFVWCCFSFYFQYTQEAVSKTDTILQFDSPAVNGSVDIQLFRTFLQLDNVNEELKSFDYHPDPSFNKLAKNVITETSIIIVTVRARSEKHQMFSLSLKFRCIEMLSLQVKFGHGEWLVGSVYYARKDDIPLAIIIPSVIVPMLLFIAVSVYCYRRKSQQAEREYEKVKHQLENLEESVRDRCKKEFTDLMIEMEDHTSDLSEARIPFLDYKTYTDRNFFLPSKDRANDTMITGKIQIPEPRRATVSQALNQFSNLLNSKTFLINFIRTLESRPDFNARARGYFASLLTVALHGKLEYYTDIMRTLLLELMDEHVQSKNPKLMLRRSETVVERMLCNWMSICLYQFLRDTAGEPLYKLFKALKHQVEKGPVDAKMKKAKYTLNDTGLLGDDVEYSVLTLQVLVHGEGPDVTPVKVLNCDTITQVKEKIIDQVYRNLPYSQRPKVESVALEWRPGSTGQILSDLDLTSQKEGRWKRLNTLAHYNVRDNATLVLSRVLHTQSFHQHQDSYEEKNALLEDDNTFHLVRPADEIDEVKSKRGSMKDKAMTKAITEIYLTRLLSVKGTLQQFVDDFFRSVLCSSSVVPPAVKYFFDFLDEQALRHDNVDEETLHIWKTNSLPLRFWVNILRNPHFIVDVHVTEVVDASLHVIAQTFMDACTKTEHKLSRESPSNKLLYAKEISTYKKMVDDYYKGIRQMVPVSDQDMNTHLAEVSRQHTDKLNTQVALHQLYQYASKYYDVIIQSLDEDPAAQNKQLTLRLQQIAAALENKVTDL
uniref:Plexin-B2-like n=1 Tax=Sphaeramia orbicularis TaxID=375764 RepID=A0A673ARH7_9TELE